MQKTDQKMHAMPAQASRRVSPARAGAQKGIERFRFPNERKVKNFIPVGMEVHGFEPTPKDIVNIKNAAAFFINGVKLEGFIDDIKKAHADLNIVDTSKGVNLIEGKHKHDEKHKHDKHSHKHHHGEFDPHIWLSLKNSKIILKKHFR